MLDSVWIKLPYVLLTLGLVMLHIEYVHRRPINYSRGFILFQLTYDLTSFGTTWVMLGHFRPEAQWVPWFLTVHIVVHVASLGWALFHWPSLKQHMIEFQARKLHPVFQAAEFLYEQSDSSLYLCTAAIVALTLPLWAVVIVVMTCSALLAAFRPTVGFATAAVEADVIPFRKAA